MEYPLPSLSKEEIAFRIKPITLAEVDAEMDLLETWAQTQDTFNGRCRVGNNVVDYFTYVERLHTKGKYNCSFYEFLEQLDTFLQKKFIRTMLTYYDTVKNKNRTKNEWVVLKEVYNICISAINIMRPLTCIEIFKRYRTRRVLNFCAGWGGSTVAAAALKLDAFYGVDANRSLAPCYERMVAYLQPRSPGTEFQVRFGDAADPGMVWQGEWRYDTVFASPPYYFIEKYTDMPMYGHKKEVMDRLFYRPAFEKAYAGLDAGGYFIINVCQEVYNRVLVPWLGEAQERFTLKKSKRQNNHTEWVCVWRKPGLT